MAFCYFIIINSKQVLHAVLQDKSRQWRDHQRGKAGDAVCLGPERHFACLCERLVSGGKQFRTVERYGETIVRHFQSQAMPCVRRYPVADAFDLATRALDHPVKIDIVLKRIRADDIVIILIHQPDRDAGRAIDRAGDGIEADRDVNVGGGYRLIDCDREAVICPVAAGLRQRMPTWGGIIHHDFPFARRPFAGAAGGQSRRQGTNRCIGKREIDWTIVRPRRGGKRGGGGQDSKPGKPASGQGSVSCARH